PRGLPRHDEAAQLPEPDRLHRHRRRAPRGEDLHEQPNALPRRDVLPVWVLPRQLRDDPAGRPQPRLADAVPVLHAGHARPHHPLRHEPRHLPQPEERVMNKTSRTFAWGFVAVVSLATAYYLFMGLTGDAKANATFNLDEFGRLVVEEGGRVKPIDSLARTSLMILSARQEYKDEKGDTQPATRWLLDVMTAASRQQPRKDAPIPGKSAEVNAYRIEDPDLRKMLRMENANGEVFSFNEVYKAAGPDKLKELFEVA